MPAFLVVSAVCCPSASSQSASRRGRVPRGQGGAFSQMLCGLGFGRSDYKNKSWVRFCSFFSSSCECEVLFAKTPSWLIPVTCHTRRTVLLFFSLLFTFFFKMQSCKETSSL